MKKNAGVDIGSSAIKLIELEDKRGRLELAKCATSPIPDRDLKSALKKLLSLAKLSSKRVNISLSGPSVIVRYVDMPPMKEEELRSSIKFEAEKYIPFNIKDSIIDCALLNKTAKGVNKVLLVAAKRREVDNLITLFKEVGLEIGAVDIDSLAVFNSFHNTHPADEDSVCALLNMGSRFTNVNIVAGGNVCFTRDMLWGGKDITNRIKDAMRVELKEAEALKQKPGEKRDEVVKVITPVLEKFVSQIRMSFDYFESQFGKNVEKLYLSGGTSYLFNIVDFLKDNLDTNTLMWNPFERISVLDSAEEVKRCPAIFAVAIGLALRQ